MARKYMQLQYDIPTVSVESKRHPGTFSKQGIVPNPSGFLRRFSFRSTKSIWVMPEEFAAREVAQLRAGWAEVNAEHGWDGEETGIVSDMLPFASDEEAVANLLRLATRQLNRMLSESQGELLEALRKGTNNLESDDDPQAHERFNRKLQNDCRKALKAIADNERAANVFGIDCIPHDNARRMVHSMRASAQQCAMLYGACAVKVRGTILERAALDGDLPIEVMADFLQDTTGEDIGEIVNTFQLLGGSR